MRARDAARKGRREKKRKKKRTKPLCGQVIEKREENAGRGLNPRPWRKNVPTGPIALNMWNINWGGCPKCAPMLTQVFTPVFHTRCFFFLPIGAQALKLSDFPFLLYTLT